LRFTRFRFAARFSQAKRSLRAAWGALAAIAALALAQILLALAKSPLARIAVGLAFALPAGGAGYFAMRGIAGATMPVSAWQQGLPIVAAIAIAAMCWTRLGRWR
jgi:hypothetical protein